MYSENDHEQMWITGPICKRRSPFFFLTSRANHRKWITPTIMFDKPEYAVIVKSFWMFSFIRYTDSFYGKIYFNVVIPRSNNSG